MRIDAPAKLNLSLRVLGRRDDGYHEIDSVMVRLPELSDALELGQAVEDRLECDDPEIPTGPENLVWRAVAVWREASGRGEPLSIRLGKRIPHGAGLGGGSSDAAAILRGLNDFFGTPLSSARLIELAAGIGSDVAFFLGPPVGRVSGRGEILGAGPAVGAHPVLLLKPEFGVSTPSAYRAWSTAGEIPGIDYGAQRCGSLELVNDLERAVFAKHRFLAEMKHWLVAQPEIRAGLMSGSGSTMFGILSDPEAAEGVVARARRELDPTLWAWSGMTAAGVKGARASRP